MFRFDAYRVFGLVFIACLLVQGWTWLNYWPLDHEVWVDGVHRYARGRMPGEVHPMDQYPSTTIFMPAGVLAAAGLTGDQALRLTMAFLISVVAALNASAAFLLRPATWWWVFVAWLLVIQPLYTLSTPASALLSPLAALFAFLVLLARERGDYSLGTIARIGICGGAMLATRLDMSGVFVAAATVYLAGKHASAFYTLPLFTVASFLLFDPYLLHSPIQQVLDIVDIILLHAKHLGTTNAVESIMYASVFGVAALAAACVLLYTRRLESLPRDFTIFLATVSAVITLILFISTHHPPWLFYPPFLVWELMLPFIVTDGVRALPERSGLRAIASTESFRTALVAAYMAYQLWLFFFRVI